MTLKDLLAMSFLVYSNNNKVSKDSRQIICHRRCQILSHLRNFRKLQEKYSTFNVNFPQEKFIIERREIRLVSKKSLIFDPQRRIMVLLSNHLNWHY